MQRISIICIYQNDQISKGYINPSKLAKCVRVNIFVISSNEAMFGLRNANDY